MNEFEFVLEKGSCRAGTYGEDEDDGYTANPRGVQFLLLLRRCHAHDMYTIEHTTGLVTTHPSACSAITCFNKKGLWRELTEAFGGSFSKPKMRVEAVQKKLTTSS